MRYRQFRKTYTDHDFRLIHDTLRKYYSGIGSKRLTAKEFQSSPGFKKIQALMEDSFSDPKVYKEKWGKFASFLKKKIKRPVYSYLNPFGPCFQGEIELEEVKTNDFIGKKTLIFYISALGPFFSIHGVDRSTAILPIDIRNRGHMLATVTLPAISDSRYHTLANFEAVHVITVSPVYEYASLFNSIEEAIREWFPGYSFIPYDIGMSTVRNISIKEDSEKAKDIDTIYEGIFGRTAVYDCPSRGDTRYRYSDWVKKLTPKELKLLRLISEHVLGSDEEISIHNVWKLQEQTPLSSFKRSGNLTFGIEMFDVIDLTDESSVITVSKEYGKPSTGKYKISNNVIELSKNCSLSIVDISQNSLTMNMLLNIHHNKVSLTGEVMEMKFVRMKMIE